MKTSFVLKDDSMPRTHFWHQFLGAAVRNARFSEDVQGRDTVLFPAEECSPSLNWPRFDDFRSAFVRGSYCDAELAKYTPYLLRFCGSAACRG